MSEILQIYNFTLFNEMIVFESHAIFD